MVIKYLTSKSLHDLQEDVNKHLRIGWDLYDGLIISSFDVDGKTYHQAVTNKSIFMDKGLGCSVSLSDLEKIKF